MLLSARVCARLERAVADAEAAAARNGLELDPEVAQAVAELHELAAWWRASVPSAALDGRDAAGGASPTMMTTTEAAASLHITPSRVRQLLRAGTLAGVRRGGRWQVHPASVSGTRGG